LKQEPHFELTQLIYAKTVAPETAEVSNRFGKRRMKTKCMTDYSAADQYLAIYPF
jgi:hypothetical protein